MGEDDTSTISAIVRLQTQMETVLSELTEIRRQLRSIAWRVALIAGALGAAGGFASSLGIG